MERESWRALQSRCAIPAQPPTLQQPKMANHSPARIEDNKYGGPRENTDFCSLAKRTAPLRKHTFKQRREMAQPHQPCVSADVPYAALQKRTAVEFAFCHLLGNHGFCPYPNPTFFFAITVMVCEDQQLLWNFDRTLVSCFVSWWTSIGRFTSTPAQYELALMKSNEDLLSNLK
ncbi:hypothetical protein F2P81_005066 [Scophthalmus maximus]|uniref:Uncharacterized protein n=1 Tax=Scophthalmus maximus TaxID=52904 RepID=A0A6A4TFX6_SCOMX|nr:hypothetical protein F2P81_005066 [Scophthalmus maximus]